MVRLRHLGQQHTRNKKWQGLKTIGLGRIGALLQPDNLDSQSLGLLLSYPPLFRESRAA